MWFNADSLWAALLGWVDLFWSRVLRGVLSRTNWVFFELWITWFGGRFCLISISKLDYFQITNLLKIVIHVSSCVFFFFSKSQSESGSCSLLNLPLKLISILLDLVLFYWWLQNCKVKVLNWIGEFGWREKRIWRRGVWTSASPKKPPPLQI